MVGEAIPLPHHSFHSRETMSSNNGTAIRPEFPAVAAKRTHPELRHQLLMVYGTGIAVGLHLGLIVLATSGSRRTALFMTVASLFYSTASLLLWQNVLPRFSDRPFLSRLAYQAGIAVLTFTVVSVVSVEAHSLLTGASSFLFPYAGGDRTVTIPAQAIRNGPPAFGLVAILPSALLCLVGFNQYWRRISALHGRQEELRELAASAQLAALRAQVNPHFLFNTLNSIAQLVATDPAKAEDCIERLADLYRYILNRANAQFVSLADELRMAEWYLEIEQVRFGDALVVERQIDGRALPVMVPSLILQPLVENAVKHGIGPKVGGGRVTIRASLDNGSLYLAVTDTGVGVRDRATIFERGIGLRNVRDRLAQIYRATGQPQVSCGTEGGTTVSIWIPTGPGDAP
jgi:signal transduction histidine kinase